MVHAPRQPQPCRGIQGDIGVYVVKSTVSIHLVVYVLCFADIGMVLYPIFYV